ncbi:MAG: DUF2493 domain-containing protein [Parvularculales bacterium]
MNYDHTQNQFDKTIERLETHGGHSQEWGMDVEDQRGDIPAADVETMIGSLFEQWLEFTEDTKSEDDFDDIISAFTTGIHFVIGRLERKQDNVMTEIGRLTRENDLSEIKNSQIEAQTNLGQSINYRLVTLEHLRDNLIDQMAIQRGYHWNSPDRNAVMKYGSNAKTAASISGQQFVHATKQKQNLALVPEGTRIGFSGGKDYQDHEAIYACLDKCLAKYPDMVLVHGGWSQGAEHIAFTWARNKKVPEHTVVAQWKTFKKAAPFKRNEEMCGPIFDLKGMIVCPGSGIQEHIAKYAKDAGIPVMRLGPTQS